jgi:hypothetical protein
MASPDLERKDERQPGGDGPSESRPLAAGRSVAEWLVVGVLREEPDHVLYAVTHGSGGPPACLKLIDPSPLHDSAYFRHLRRATRRWKRLANPHLVRLNETGRSHAGPYLATALFVGPPLAVELEKGPLDPADAGKLAAEVAGALDAVLSADLRPGPLTPRDITLTSAGALVTDPGIGHGPAREPVDASDAVHYISPEEARGEPPVAQSAVYSLACLMHECLTGARPYPRDLPQAVLYAHVAEPPPRPSERNKTLPPQVDEVFEQAMAAAPEERHATPGDFARELTGALDGSRVAAPSRAEQHQARPAITQAEPRRERPAVTPGARRALALAGAIALCAAVGFALGSGDDSNDQPAPAPVAAPAPPADAVAARAVVEQLEPRRARLRDRLTGARRRAGQAEMARRLAGLHAGAAQGAQEASPGVRRALADARRAYARLGRAATARRREQRAWAAARADAARADAALNRELARSGG